MRTCGGERRLSRPIVRCHATSQRRPGKPSQPAPSARASATVTGWRPERTCYPPRMSPPGQALARTVVLLMLASLASIPAATAADRTNVPLKNWGGFSESRAQIGDFLSVYLQPELLENEDYDAARLATGYAKLTVGNVELLVGRDSLAWGPGYHNGLLLTNNAAPLDQIKIGAAGPFLLP